MFGMIVVIFELCILVVSMAFFSIIRPVVFGPHAVLSIGIGVVIGFVDFFLTWFFVQKFDRSRTISIEFHASYHDSSCIDRYTWRPMLVSVAEEFFFRALLANVIGWFWSTVAFGLLHALNFKDKPFAFIIACLYGISFFIPLWLTGSLIGSIVAHYIFTIVRIWYFPDHGFTLSNKK